jgi:hypothetical protein
VLAWPEHRREPVLNRKVREQARRCDARRRGRGGWAGW